jgi:hypothetical protein
MFAPAFRARPHVRPLPVQLSTSACFEVRYTGSNGEDFLESPTKTACSVHFHIRPGAPRHLRHLLLLSQCLNHLHIVLASIIRIGLLLIAIRRINGRATKACFRSTLRILITGRRRQNPSGSCSGRSYASHQHCGLTGSARSDDGSPRVPPAPTPLLWKSGANPASAVDYFACTTLCFAVSRAPEVPASSP